ncbi:MAG TPA: sulfur carrier protein ThiS [Acidimicrobiales bacterium]|nr:sulfur carrier protein ThiS [Acidimicrobiales bacterium]
MAASITVLVNDAHIELPAGITLTAVLDQLGVDGRGTALAQNGEVAPRSEWPTTVVAEGDRLEILTVAQGG